VHRSDAVLLRVDGRRDPGTPHFLHGDGLLSAAGLTWSVELPSGEEPRCFVVITREARDASGEVHDRMPAFLTPDTWGAWLTPERLTGETRRRRLWRCSITPRATSPRRSVSTSSTGRSATPAVVERDGVSLLELKSLACRQGDQGAGPGVFDPLNLPVYGDAAEI